MFIIFDNLVAAVVGSAILLIVLATNTRMMEMGIDEVSNYAAKRYASDLAEWMEDDLLRLGENMEESSTTPFTNPVNINDGVTDLTESFVFYRDSTNTTVTPNVTHRIETTYSIVSAGTGKVGDKTVNLYRIKRYEKIDGGPKVYTGGAVPLVSYFKVDMLDANANVISNPAASAEDVSSTRVRFSIVTPFQTDRTAVRKVHYGSTLLVNNL